MQTKPGIIQRTPLLLLLKMEFKIWLGINKDQQLFCIAPINNLKIRKKPSYIKKNK